MGVSGFPQRVRGLFPQLRAAIAPAALCRGDVNLREAAVLGLAGAGGIGTPLVFAMNQYAWNEAAALALGLVLLTWAVDALSFQLRARLK